MAVIQYLVMVHLSEQVKLTDLETEQEYHMCKIFAGNSQKSCTTIIILKKQLNLIKPNFMQRHHFRLRINAANIIFSYFT